MNKILFIKIFVGVMLTLIVIGIAYCKYMIRKNDKKVKEMFGDLE